MRARDVMVRAVVTTSPETTVEELARLMLNLRISGVPVMDKDGRLVGMVTDRDIVCKGIAKENFDVRRATARDVMTSGIHCCKEDDDLTKAAQHMEQLKVRRLPVIDKDKRMVGVLSRHDTARALSSDRPN